MLPLPKNFVIVICILTGRIGELLNEVQIHPMRSAVSTSESESDDTWK